MAPTVAQVSAVHRALVATGLDASGVRDSRICHLLLDAFGCVGAGITDNRTLYERTQAAIAAMPRERRRVSRDPARVGMTAVGPDALRAAYDAFCAAPAVDDSDAPRGEARDVAPVGEEDEERADGTGKDGEGEEEEAEGIESGLYSGLKRGFLA